MKEIVERLQEKRNIEVAKEILESNGYKVTKRSTRRVNERRLIENSDLLDSLSDHVDDIINYLEDGGDPDVFGDMKLSPEVYGFSSESIETILSILGTSSILFYTTESPEAKPSVFKPLQYPEFYKGTAKKLGNLDPNAGEDLEATVIVSPLGKIIQEEGYGVSNIYMPFSTRDKVIKYLNDMKNKGDKSLAKYLSRWSE